MDLTPAPASAAAPVELLPEPRRLGPLARLAPGKILVVGPSDNSRLLLHVLRAGAAWHLFEADREMPLYGGRRFAEWTTVEGPAPVRRGGRYFSVVEVRKG